MKIMDEHCYAGYFSDEEEAEAEKWLKNQSDEAIKSTTTPGLLNYPLLLSMRQYELTLIYELGLGVQKNMRLAVHYYGKSAALGLHKAKMWFHEFGIDWDNA